MDNFFLLFSSGFYYEMAIIELLLNLVNYFEDSYLILIKQNLSAWGAGHLAKKKYTLFWCEVLYCWSIIYISNLELLFRSSFGILGSLIFYIPSCYNDLVKSDLFFECLYYFRGRYLIRKFTKELNHRYKDIFIHIPKNIPAISRLENIKQNLMKLHLKV